jgi:hypothetical protein
MNSTSCPLSTSSDYIFGFPSNPTSPQPTCELNIASVQAAISILVGLKLSTIIYLIYRNQQRSKYLIQQGRTSETKRIPLTVLSSLLFLLLVILLFISINSPMLYSNGTNLLLYGLGNSLLCANSSLHLRKIERLGFKLQGTNTVVKSNSKGIIIFIISILQFCIWTIGFIASLLGVVIVPARIPAQIMLSCTLSFLILYHIRFYYNNNQIMNELRKVQNEQNSSQIRRQKGRFKFENMLGMFTSSVAVVILAVMIWFPSLWLVIFTIMMESVSVIGTLLVQARSILFKRQRRNQQHNHPFQGHEQQLPNNNQQQQEPPPITTIAELMTVVASNSNDISNHHQQQQPEPQSFMLFKQPSQYGSMIGEEVTLKEIINAAKNADVVEDKNDSFDVSILTNHDCIVSDSNTLFVKIVGFTPVTLLKILNPIKSPLFTSAMVIIFTILGDLLIGLVMVGIFPTQVAFLQLGTFIWTCLLMSATIDTAVVIRLVKTAWFLVRIATNWVAIALLGDVFGGDYRIALLPALATGPLFMYLGDGFIPSVESTKLAVAIAQTLTTLLIACLLQFDLVMNSNNRILQFNAVSTYSVYQLCRDLFVSSAFFGCFEIYDLMKRQNSPRLAHVGVRVMKMVKPYDFSQYMKTATSPDGSIAGIVKGNNNHKPVAGASQIEIKSGYFVPIQQEQSTTYYYQQQSQQPQLDEEEIEQGNDNSKMNENSQMDNNISDDNNNNNEEIIKHHRHHAVTGHQHQHRPRNIVLNAVVLKEVDSLACWLFLMGGFSISTGMKFFRFVQYQLLWVILCSSAYALLALVLILTQTAPIEICYGMIPLMILYVTRQTSMLSRAVLLLLVKRIEFWVQLSFSCGWIILMNIVMPHDGRLILIWYAWLYVCLDSLDDAHLTTRSDGFRLLGRSIEKLIIGIFFILVGVFIFLRSSIWLGDNATTVQYIINFRPDLPLHEGVGISDQPSVLDVVQSTADLTLSMGLRYFSEMILLFVTGSSFTNVKAPVTKIRRGVNGGGISSSSSNTGAIDTNRESNRTAKIINTETIAVVVNVEDNQ